MMKIETSATFAKWLEGLRDTQGRGRILIRLKRLTAGNFGDCKSLGGGLVELRMTFGPGYRVYYAQDGDALVILLCGGDKSSQARDIAKARELLNDWRSK